MTPRRDKGGALAYPALMCAAVREGFRRTDEDMRRVRDLARAGIERYGLGELHPDDLARPLATPGDWKDYAWLTGVRDLLDWLLGDREIGPLGHTRAEGLPSRDDLADELDDLDEAQRQGSSFPVNPNWPPPQAAEAMGHTRAWLTGRTSEAPVCSRHALGFYACSDEDDQAIAL
jgi:hypothetical protein